MKKRKLLLTLLGVLMALPAIAKNFNYEYEGKTLTYTTRDDGTCMVASGSNVYGTYANVVSGTVIIPEIAYDDDETPYKVVLIGWLSITAPYDKPTSIIIPKTVYGVYERAIGSGVIKIAYPNTFTWPSSLYAGIAYDPENSIIDEGWIYGPEKKEILFAPQNLDGDYTVSENVTSIGQSAFYGCNCLTSLVIPESVKSIGDGAFSRCTGLKTIDIKAPIDTLNNRLLEWCNNVQTVKLPASLKVIGKSAFYYCQSLSSIELPNSVEAIGGSAFRSCEALSSIELPNSVKTIGNSAFDYCVALSSIDIPDLVEVIGSYTFRNCSKLSSVKLPESLRRIEPDAFTGCNKLTSITATGSTPAIFDETSFSGLYDTATLSIPAAAAVDYLNTNWSLFKNMRQTGSGMAMSIFSDGVLNYRLIPAVKEGENNTAFIVQGDYSGAIDVPERFADTTTDPANPQRYYITGIGYKAFAGSKLSKITFNSRIGLKTIAEGAFASCNSLDTIALPATVESLGSSAFANCGKLVGVTLNDGLKTIAEGAFASCNSLDTIALPATVESLGSSAFANCGKLAGVTLNDGLKEISESAFKSCNSLDSIAIPSSVETIGSYAFYNNSKLLKIEFNEGLRTIGDRAFYSESEKSIDAIYIPSTVTSIGGSAFYGTNFSRVDISDLAAWCDIDFSNGYANPARCLFINQVEANDIVVPAGISKIKPYTFYDCSSLSSVVLPVGVESIGRGSFSGCSSLSSVVLPEGVESIGEYGFSGCSSLSYVVLPEGLESIGENSFSGCSSLASIEFPEGLESIGEDSFKSCSSLTSVVFLEGLRSLGMGSFRNCSQLASVTLPQSLDSIGARCFYDCSSMDSIVIPGNVTYIGLRAIPFSNIIFADGTAEINIEDGNYYYPKQLYWGRPLGGLNSGLSLIEKLAIGNVPEEIPAGRFKDLANLKSLTLGSNLRTIGDEAFKGCKHLKEVILPPSVETVGASAFAGDSLATIIMGHKVKSIGELAFDGCPASTVSITAQTPPTAANNTFSTYTGKLWLQGKAAVDAYYDAFTCWDRFNGYAMVEATELKYDGEKNIIGEAGDTFQLRATLMPDNVTLPQVFWRSTNPDIATVDENGLVTLRANLQEVISRAGGDDESGKCSIIAESLYANGPVVEVTVYNSDFSDIDAIEIDRTESDEIDYDAPVEVYGLNGVRMGNTTEGLAAGIYIVRQGAKVKKIAVR